MANKLIVYRSGQRVGVLSRDEDSYFFSYDTAWLVQYRPAPLSISLPLREEPFSAKESKPFFSNLLPEGQLRDHYANKHRVSAEDDFALLEALAGDCAGAIALYPEETSSPSLEDSNKYLRLTEENLEKLLNEAFIMDPTFLGPEEKTRLSLAGVQDKLPVMIKNEEIFLPLDGAPSTHIIKPQNLRFEYLVENEAYCMALANEIGLKVPRTFILEKSERAYVVERYDRKIHGNENIVRIHQEDFCQALGFSYRKKYEQNGGPGHEACFDLVKRFKEPLADKIKLMDLTVFNLLISNFDCHSKNISILYDSGVAPSLAPFYDLLCVGVYNLSHDLAMSIGGVFNPKDLSLEAWQKHAQMIGLPTPKPIFEAISKMAEKVPEASIAVAHEMSKKYGDNEFYQQIVDHIAHRTKATLRQIKH